MKNLSKAIAIASVLIAALTACDDKGDNYLDGSLADNYDMDFDSVRIRLYDSELAIEYVQETGSGDLVPLRLTINTNMVALEADTIYDLAEYGTVTRGQGFDSSYLPDLKEGTLTLDGYSGEAGSNVNGSFEATFSESDGATTTLWGGFSSSLEIPEI